jgi:hypothetical protein
MVPSSIFKQSLLDPSPRRPGDGNVLGLAGDLVDFVDVNDPELGPTDVVIRILQQAKDDVLHVLADITGLGQGRGIRDGEGDVEEASPRSWRAGSCRSPWAR